jgi:NADH-quinone oxidoreductase subunit L
MLLAEVPTNPVFYLAPWVVFLPAIGLVLNLLLGRRLGELGAGLIACLAVIGSFIVAVVLGINLATQAEGPAITVPLLEWIHIGTLNANWAFRVDELSVVMMLVVSGVGALIHIYAVGYMHSDVRHNGDPGRFTRFFVYLNLFIAMMMILVTADNFLMLFVGWEGVGLCSYLLIGFWFEKGAGGIANARAAKKAFVANRVGDFGLLIALFIIFANFGSFDFNTVFAGVGQAAPLALTAITLFMLLGVAGKSAQIPLYVWLPDAMAGPTPVSALIHAATMVTAGVYLVARSSALYMAVPVAQGAVTWVGALTAFFAATIAVGQYDIKKVLAYSTISQLGFMVAAVGMGAYTAGIFHLVTHAFFKALLFLGAGSVILGMEHGHAHTPGGHTQAEDHGHAEEFDPQDMRNMGGLRERMPLTFWVYLIGALALAGIAPLAGFFSKDEILAAASQNSPVIFALLILAAFLTAFYVCRQLLMVFFGKGRTPAAGNAVESPALVTVPLVVLAVLSALGGLLNFPGLHWLETWLEPVLKEPASAGFVPLIAGTSLGVALLGLLLAWLFYGQRKHTPVPGQVDPLGATPLAPLIHALERKWWVDEIYQAILLTPYTEISRFLAENFDQGLIDGIVNGMGWLAAGTARLWGTLQNGFVRRYALSIVAGVVVILAYLLLH